MQSDAMDIMDMDRSGTPEISRETIMNENKKPTAAQRRKNEMFKRPKEMSRELYNLFLADNKDPTAPVVPTDLMPGGQLVGGYKQAKAKFGLKKARPWKWMPFANPGRKDGFKLYHWRRIADADKEYPFSKFNTSVSISSYTDADYSAHLQVEGWTKAETDHLFELCKRFDLRFMIIQDRWDKIKFTTQRSVEDLKERYYNAVNTLTKAKPQSAGVPEPKVKNYDANHERKRKEQLVKQYNRTPEQIEEEQKLLEEMRKIEMHKREREKKTQDLQKLITAADANEKVRKSETPVVGRPGRGPGRKKLSLPRASAKGSDPGTPLPTSVLEAAGIKFPESKTAGASLRSQRMKLPASVGQKKSKAIEQLLQELNIDLRPMPTDEICTHFNELRSDMVLLYELKMALANCEFELQTLKHQYQALFPPNTFATPSTGASKGKSGKAVAAAVTSTASTPTTPAPSATTTSTASVETPTTAIVESGEVTPTTPTAPVEKKTISDVIESQPVTPNRKRRAALEQGNLMKKIKKLS